MGGHHGHDHCHHHHTTKNIGWAFLINLLFTIIEFFGAWLTNSVAILSDALHDIGDSFALGLAWFLEKYSDKEKDDQYSYGYKRYSVLGAIINCIILVTGAIAVIYLAINRLLDPQEVDAKGMILFSILGIVFNGLAYYKTSGGDSLNERTVSLHLLEDVLGWLAVLIGSVIIYFFDIHILDPILSVLIALYILFNAFKSLKSALIIIMQKLPHSVDIDAVKGFLNSQAEISSIHDLHCWTMDGHYNILTFHAIIEDDLSSENRFNLKSRIKEELRSFKLHHITIEFELKNEACDLIDD